MQAQRIRRPTGMQALNTAQWFQIVIVPDTMHVVLWKRICLHCVPVLRPSHGGNFKVVQHIDCGTDYWGMLLARLSSRMGTKSRRKIETCKVVPNKATVSERLML